MRVLLVSHLFPPDHEAGTERYTAELGRQLAGLGHEVAVFTTTKDIARADGSVAEREYAGLAVRELVNNLFYEEFEETWRRPVAERALADFLDEWRPDVVHFQHLMYLSAGCLAEAARRGVAVVFTLHDFWLECPRFGQLVHADGALCETVDFARCGTCLESFEWRQPPAWRRAGQAIAGVKRTLGVDLGPLAREAGRRLRRGRPAEDGAGEPEAPGPEATALAQVARERTDELRSAVLEHVDRFVSPSRFLLERLQRWGLPAERCVHFATGIDRARFAAQERPARDPSARVRVAFLGTLVPVKGPHLLLEAWGALTDDQRERGELVLYGPAEHAPAYVARLEERAAQVGARLAGALDRDGVARALAETDLLVVPSTWYENRPLVVLEALATGTALVVSDPGGMAELVEDGVTGWRFPMGDARALAARLAAVLDEPSSLDRLDFDAVPIADWNELARKTVELYEDVRAGHEAS